MTQETTPPQHQVKMHLRAKRWLCVHKKLCSVLMVAGLVVAGLAVNSTAQNNMLTQTPLLEAVVISAPQAIQNSVIWLHGLGSDGHDFEPFVAQLNLPHTRFILPHAPYRAVSANNGYEMRAWYDVFGFARNSPQDETGIRATQMQINALIAHEIASGVPANRIVLVGFSQGGAIALHTGLRYPETLAGVMALSTYLPLRPFLAAEKTIANQKMPIFMAHGTHDNIIALEIAQLSKQALEDENYTVEWHEYEMAHSVNPQEMADIRAFLLKTLP